MKQKLEINGDLTLAQKSMAAFGTGLISSLLVVRFHLKLSVLFNIQESEFKYKKQLLKEYILDHLMLPMLFSKITVLED